VISPRIAALLQSAPVIDGHNDLPWALRLGDADLTHDQSAAGLHTDLPRLAAGGVGAQFWSVWVPSDASGPAAIRAALLQFDVVHGLVRRYADRLALARSADEVERVRNSGRVASLIGVEGGHMIDESLAVLRMFHALGARYLTLTHNDNTPWADSAADTPAHGGLTDFGREVVRECNRLGVMVDLSHTAPETMHAALDVSTAPAFFSHSSARALCSHSRNVPDEVLGRVRDSNGVVMVMFVPGFLTEECHAWFDKLAVLEADLTAQFASDSRDWHDGQRAWIAANPPPPTSIADIADHVEHVREVAGVEHVGLGGDFDGVAVLPTGVTGVDAYPAILEELAQRGWSDEDLAKLTWGNALRVLRDTEAVAEL
jgi:membrane dipeptidase